MSDDRVYWRGRPIHEPDDPRRPVDRLVVLLVGLLAMALGAIAAAAA